MTPVQTSPDTHPEAEAILPDIEAIFARLDSVDRQLQDLKGGRIGTLSVAGAFPIANGYLAAAVASFQAERPRLRVVLQSLTSPEVIDRVVSREVELGIAFEPVVNPEVETEVLITSGVSCVMRDLLKNGDLTEEEAEALCARCARAAEAEHCTKEPKSA